MDREESDFDGNTEFGTPGAWVEGNLIVGRDDGPGIDETERRRGASEEIDSRVAIEVAGLHEILDEAILKGMVGDDSETTAGLEDAESLLKESLEGIDFAIDLDAQSLEDLSELLLLLSGIDEGADDLEQALDGGDGSLLTGLDDSCSDASGIFEFAQEKEHIGELGFGA